jgi:hypothetical protein
MAKGTHPHNPADPIVRAYKQQRLGLRIIQAGEIRPYWSAVEVPGQAREWMVREGFAEFKHILNERVGKRAVGRVQANIWFARLTLEGVRVRDEYDRKQAEQKNRRLTREMRLRHARSVARRARRKRSQKPAPDGAIDR